jgi:Flp pilus assembly protein TadG
MRKLFQGFWRDDRGVAMVEYALLVPVLSVLMIGIVDYGMYIHEKMELDDLARDSVQYVLQGGDYNNIQAAVIAPSDIYNKVDPNELTVTVTPPSQSCECSGGAAVSCSSGGTCPSGDYKRGFVTVTIAASYHPIVTWPGIAANKTMTGTAKMQYNW